MSVSESSSKIRASLRRSGSGNSAASASLHLSVFGMLLSFAKCTPCQFHTCAVRAKFTRKN